MLEIRVKPGDRNLQGDAETADRLSQIDRADLPADLDPGEVRRVAASIYGLEAIASELRDLAKVMETSGGAA